MERALLKHVQLLVKLNATTFVAFLTASKPNLIADALNELTSFPCEKYHFLEAIIELA